MTPRRWRRIEEVVGAALATPAPERPAFLDSACGGDAEMRAEVEGLLANGDAASSLRRAVGLRERDGAQHEPAIGAVGAAQPDLVLMHGEGALVARANLAVDGRVIVGMHAVAHRGIRSEEHTS